MSIFFSRPVSRFVFSLALTAFSGIAVASVSTQALSKNAANAVEPAASFAAAASFIDSKLSFGRETVNVTWFLPGTEQPKGFVVLFHGFARNKGHMRDLASRLQKEGLVVLTPTLGLGLINNLEFLKAMAEGLRTMEKVPGTDVALPANVVVAGHSAGGKNAAILASLLRTSLGERLVGALLLDPVERDGQLEGALKALEGTSVDVLSVLARPSSCNANSNATELLKRYSADFKGIRFAKGSHCDAEGTSTDLICRLPCGAPQKTTMESTQAFAVNWILGFFEGSRRAAYFPGGDVLGGLLDTSEGSLLE